MILQQALLVMAVLSASYNTHTKIAIKNEFPEDAATITLTHHYSGDEIFTQTWKDVAAGRSHTWVGGGVQYRVRSHRQGLLERHRADGRRRLPKRHA